MHKKYDFSLFCKETREFDAMTTLLTDLSNYLSQVCHLKNSFLYDHPCDKILDFVCKLSRLFVSLHQ